MADIEIDTDNSGIVNRGNNNTIIQYSPLFPNCIWEYYAFHNTIVERGKSFRR